MRLLERGAELAELTRTGPTREPVMADWTSCASMLRRVHKQAHGLVADEIYPVKEGV